MSLNMDILMLYVYDVAEVGVFRILTLIMLLTYSSSSSTLISGIGGVSIRDCTSVLRQLKLWAIFMVGCIGLEEQNVVSSLVVNLKVAVHIR